MSVTADPGRVADAAGAGAPAAFIPSPTPPLGVGPAGLLIAALLSSACAPEDNTVELRFWAMGREGEVVQEMVRDFEAENPGIRVRVQQIPWTAAHEKLLTALVGESLPDVTQLGNTWIPEFAALGALEPLGGRVARSGGIEREEYFDGIWATNVVDDTLYGIPWYVDTRVVFYRSDLLAEAGYDEMPVTWAGWREAMQALKARMAPGQYPALLPTNEWPQPVILGMQSGSSLLTGGGRRGAFSDPAFRRGFEFYVGLFRDGLAPVRSGTEVSNLFQEFARGNIAMYVTGPWNIGEFGRRLPEELQDDWATAPMPGPTGPGISTAGGSSLVLLRQSAHPDAAWRLIEFMSRPEQQVRFHVLSGNLPAVRSAWDAPELADNGHAHAFREQLERVEPLPKVPEWESIATRVYERADEAIRGAATIDETLEALDRDVDRMLEKRRWMLDREARNRSEAAEERQQLDTKSSKETEDTEAGRAHRRELAPGASHVQRFSRRAAEAFARRNGESGLDQRSVAEEARIPALFAGHSEPSVPSELSVSIRSEGRVAAKVAMEHRAS